jgi:hypothetical protein
MITEILKGQVYQLGAEGPKVYILDVVPGFYTDGSTCVIADMGRGQKYHTEYQECIDYLNEEGATLAN